MAARFTLRPDRVSQAGAVQLLWHDLRSGARILWHAPGLSLAVVLLIALVIGGNATVYSAVRRLLTAPAQGVEADRLLGVGQVNVSSSRLGPFTSYAQYGHLAAHVTTLQGLTAWAGERVTIGIDDGTYAVFGASVAPGFFDSLGVRVAPGRPFSDRDDRGSEAGLTAVISDRLWRERFQQSDVIGRHVTVNGQQVTVVGVAATGFLGPSLTPGEDIWLPVEAFHRAVGNTQALHDPKNASLLVAGQLAPGRTRAQAQAEIDTLSRQWRAAHPEIADERRTAVFDYSATAFLPVADLAPRFLAIFTIVTVLTLLVVSANVANLMLARAVSRQRETAVRRSLGASRGRVLSQLVAEALVLAVAAWATAFVLSWWVSRTLVRLLPPEPQALMVDLRPDWPVALYAMALALFATVACTLAPALQTWRQPVLPWLKAGEQSIATGRSRFSNALVIVQLAFAILLLTCAGLAYRSVQLLDSNVGYEHENLLLMTVRTNHAGPSASSGGGTTEPSAAANVALLERIRERLLQVRDVEAVTYAPRVPGPVLLTGVPVRRPGQAAPVAAMRRPVGPYYLQALGLAVVAGREIDARDRLGAPQTALINASLAAILFPDESPVGQRLEVGEDRVAVEVVGVAPDARYDGPSREPRQAFVFLAEQQFSSTRSFEPTFLIRHISPLESAAPAARRALAAVDATVPVVAMRTMTAQLDTVTALERQIAMLLAVFATLSLGIAALGQYAIATFHVRRRARDFGVRMALGATPERIQRSVIRDALTLTGIGLLMGFGLSVLAGLAFSRALVGVSPTDPRTYAAVLTLMAVTSVVASFVPAWRAGRVNVVEALRQE